MDTTAAWSESQLTESQRPLILVVDDVPEVLAVLGDILGDEGYSIRQATDGNQALLRAQQEPHPALILLDVLMPGMDGHEVLRRLQEDGSTCDIPVIFVTALDDGENIAKGLEMGANDYITKPFQPDVVLARVRNQIDARQARLFLKNQNAYLEAEVSRRMAEIQTIQAEAWHAREALSRRLELTLASVAEGIFGVDTEGVINFANPALADLLDCDSGELLGRKITDIPSLAMAGEADTESDSSPIASACKNATRVRGRKTVIRSRDGRQIPVEYSCAPLIEGDKVIGAVVTLQDISERLRYQEEIERRSNFDELTGLPNRNLVNDRLNHALKRRPEDDREIVVLTINLDRFRAINESLGFEAGNSVLKEVADRLSKRVRQMDTLGRFDGDEFVLIAETSGPDAAAKLAHPLLALLTPPFYYSGHELFLTGSIGIALYPKDGDDADTLLRNASAAMYKAKVAGGNCFRYYTSEMNARSLERLDIENGLRRAIDNNELVVYYQPQLSLRTGQIVGAEALVRWQHPDRGLVMPGEFIALAEECGLIIPLGEQVLRAACLQNKAWQDAGLPPITVAVNMSARHFAAQNVVALAGKILGETGLAPNYLELELTESSVMADADAFIHATEQLKGLAITLSIDDFGTGFSSLSYLKRFAIDRLKIDQSFVRDVIRDPNSAAIARAIISLAHSLKLSAIAEGVETEAQLEFLRRENCDEMQGFFFSRPIPAEEFGTLLREHRQLQLSHDSQIPNRTLLLVDDEPAILSSLKRLLRREGYTILTASGGQEGLEALANHDVGVIISDARMPGMNGGEFLGKVREIYPDIVRIMLSGYTDLKSVTSAVNRGELFCFMTKPWDDNELLETLRDAFRHYETRRRVRTAAVDVGSSEP
ncbi:MAG: EAL domain-containing protein [Actinomycetota bacterium]